MKYYLIFIFTLSFEAAMSQEGPVIECFNCADLTAKPYPTNGNWYNPSQSGSGYLIEIQNGLLSGFYFGYDENGAPTWTNFVGILEEVGDGVLWTLDAEILKFENGNAINQPFQAPNAEPTGDNIHIDFLFENYAKVSVNGGDVQNMIPIIHGVGLSNSLPEIDYLFPDLEGMWTLVYDNNDPSISEQYRYNNQVYYIGERMMGNNSDGSISICAFHNILSATFRVG